MPSMLDDEGDSTCSEDSESDSTCSEDSESDSTCSEDSGSDIGRSVVRRQSILTMRWAQQAYQDTQGPVAGVVSYFEYRGSLQCGRVIIALFLNVLSLPHRRSFTPPLCDTPPGSAYVGATASGLGVGSWPRLLRTRGPKCGAQTERSGFRGRWWR